MLSCVVIKRLKGFVEPGLNIDSMMPLAYQICYHDTLAARLHWSLVPRQRACFQLPSSEVGLTGYDKPFTTPLTLPQKYLFLQNSRL